MTAKIFRTSFLAVAFAVFFMGKSAHAQPANITLTSDDDNVTISWQETTNNPVDYFSLESSFNNGATWDPVPIPPSNSTQLQFPRSLYVNVFPVDFDIRITTVYLDTTSSAPISQSLSIPPSPGFAPSSRFTYNTPSVLVGDAARKADGLNLWLDGNLGLFERGGQIFSISPNGPDTARITADGQDIYGTVNDANILIQNQAISSDHSSGGPVYYDEPNDRLLMFYHGEIHDPDPSDFYSYIGLAQSYDGGATFEDLGQIIRARIDITDPDRSGAVEMAGAPYIIRDGYFYVYYKDKLEDNSVVNVGVARAAVADVLADADNDTVGTWTKYYNNSFSEPGIGGIPQNVLAGQPNAVWFDVAYSQVLDEYIMVYSHNSGQQYTHLITTSSDGLTWNSPNLLYETASSYEEPYVTITSPDFSNQRNIAGNSFYLLRTISASAFTGFRWDNAWVEQNEIQINSQTPDEGEVEGATDGGGGSGGSLAETGIGVAQYVLLAVLMIAFGAALYRRSRHEPYSAIKK
jgi:hypothetical protein